ncbi:hypothetical protein CONPUDRAFT_169410 [Coniophora puteana RWD-64-598 SS2]|uniref:Uncharacterized protein n=1 Tax=Coniophora puteana (strain RWD-64-598) TaxID=741705 RepID=A0A5M3M9U2_CONPW|nr:uncharacterized protein CONPUDRAFT_169410 [Coniophora puteana RWD-64-598 SS2]EIW75624.1 hypothetical protein CONPUDRAFT_169410 [Coniophora puteana RWD-64-598 SS2]
MSSAHVIGLIRLRNGERRAATESARSTVYNYYHCFLPYENGHASAVIRHYPSSEEQQGLLPYHTIVFVIAKANFAQSPDILLDAIAFYPFPGDPNDDAYLAFMPELYRSPFFIGVGRVSAPSHGDLLPSSSPIKVYDLAVSDYVRHATANSTIQFWYDSSQPRWQNIRPPGINSSVGVMGIATGKSKCGFIQFEQLSISTGVSASSVGGSGPQPNAPAPPSSSSPSSAFLSPAKRKRLAFSPERETTPSPDPRSSVFDLEQASSSSTIHSDVSDASNNAPPPANTLDSHLPILPPGAFHPQTPQLFELREPVVPAPPAVQPDSPSVAGPSTVPAAPSIPPAIASLLSLVDPAAIQAFVASQAAQLAAANAAQTSVTSPHALPSTSTDAAPALPETAAVPASAVASTPSAAPPVSTSSASVSTGAGRARSTKTRAKGKGKAKE